MVADIEEINLGYRIAKRYWNKGLAAEAARAVLNYVFNEQKFTSVVVIIEPAHVASLKVAEKVGFSDYDVLEFHSRPVRLYRLTSQQWKILRNKESSL